MCRLVTSARAFPRRRTLLLFVARFTESLYSALVTDTRKCTDSPSRRTRIAPPGSVHDVLRSVARLRGCQTPQEVDDFLHEWPQLRNPLDLFDEATKAVNRLDQARRDHDKTLVFGDYDCDGITSTVLLLGLLEQAGFRTEELGWFIPSRFAHGYGLTIKAVQEACAKHRPKLLIAVDCGSVERESAAWVAAQGIDLVVVDHHACKQRQSPAQAHVNFKLAPNLMKQANNLCAAGVVYFLCEQLAGRWKIDTWDRFRAVLLAGLATCADVVPLLGLNRALLKRSLRIANQDRRADSNCGLGKVRGLVAVLEMEEPRLRWIDETQYGFLFGPCLNACGRLEHAQPAVELLMAREEAQANALAATCIDYNKQRQVLEDEVTTQALAQAKEQVRLGRHVLFAMEESWHQGVVGIAAGRLKEQFHRPTIVCTRVDGAWRGSGRSVKGYAMGNVFYKAAGKGLICRGGGHDMAGGLQVYDEQIEHLAEWLEAECSLRTEDLVAHSEYIAEVSEFSASEWCDIYSKLSPFGAENPRPDLSIASAVLVGKPAVIRRANMQRSLSQEQIEWLLQHADLGDGVRQKSERFLEKLHRPQVKGAEAATRSAEPEAKQAEKPKLDLDVIGLRSFFRFGNSRKQEEIQLTALRWWKLRGLWETRGQCRIELTPKRFKDIAGGWQHELVITDWEVVPK